MACLALALAGAAGPVAAASAAPAPARASCEMVWQYRVTEAGEIWDEWGPIGQTQAGDLFNVRHKGNPRYYGYLPRTGKWGWVLASKLDYTGNSWCA
ncbi:hypothetical protein FKR81_20695 [Lentzea tibetensis]|uniref:SH3 domain-containing protein n=1 Tax=Lentzea tibetensis TaxID=2591470 RepID=A0A563ESB2_9PSEU|nr:hypothetical protein [Lentzea tibetensis]TWP50587.1 hypothetical protein FKR81_20695 [Lentzea tibetensis]